MVTPSSELAALFWAPPSKKADGLLGTMGAAVVRRAFLATSFALAAEVERGAAGARSARGRLRVILEAIVGFGVGGGRGRGRGRDLWICCRRAAPNGAQRLSDPRAPFRHSPICFPRFIPFLSRLHPAHSPAHVSTATHTSTPHHAPYSTHTPPRALVPAARSERVCKQAARYRPRRRSGL